ncbi:MAG: hypothetical protein M1832_005885 [Thelocarpon impressellum]|nr:MAG: hypothetical protein M1832_005885 [Thelocarpon impressellum]
MAWVRSGQNAGFRSGSITPVDPVVQLAGFDAELNGRSRYARPRDTRVGQLEVGVADKAWPSGNASDDEGQRREKRKKSDVIEIGSSSPEPAPPRKRSRQGRDVDDFRLGPGEGGKPLLVLGGAPGPVTAETSPGPTLGGAGGPLDAAQSSTGSPITRPNATSVSPATVASLRRARRKAGPAADAWLDSGVRVKKKAAVPPKVPISEDILVSLYAPGGLRFGQPYADDMVRHLSETRLQSLRGPPVTLRNNVDETVPPLKFDFINECLVREGVERVTDEWMTGCECRPDNGRHVGCEYTTCSCLSNMEIKRFPYVAVGPRKGCLSDRHLNTREAIFECNEKCSCHDDCKNKVVQWGRSVPLQIFHTGSRGWGLRCLVDLRKGEFIDTYRGEVITEEECKERDAKRLVKDVYTFALDKFQDDNEDHAWAQAHRYVVDGEFYGGPTRYINHSCEPNVRQFTASYNHSDPSYYHLAFFAKEEIEAGTELTFDYLDRDDTTMTTSTKAEKGMTRCLCGSKNCKGWLWM